MVKNYVPTFNTEFERVVKVGFPSRWDFGGVSIEWEQYNQRLIEAKIKVDSFHEKVSTIKIHTMVNYLKRYFQLLGMVNTLFHPRLNCIGLSNLKITYQQSFHVPLPVSAL